MMMGDKKEKAAAIIIGFDDTSAINLKNPFSKKPSLRGKNKSVISSKGLMKGVEPKRTQEKVGEEDPFTGERKKEISKEE